MRWVIAFILFAFATALPAFAHSSARGFVLLLPTNYVILGGALAVFATFIAITLLPGSVFQSAIHSPEKQRSPGPRLPHTLSLLSAAALIALIWIGFTGPQDPVENLLPLSIWTLWWVVIVLLHPLFGNLWAGLNPFAGVYGVMRMGPILTFPQRLHYVPACLIFAAFAWFQLVYPAPEDPQRLAMAVSAYAAFTLLAVFVFGSKAWLEKGDPFGIFLSQLGAAAPLVITQHIGLRIPGIGLVSRPALPIMGTLFVLLTLNAISFDGFANTFLWLSAIGINPLDYPGRTALVFANSLGLAVSFILLAAAYMAAIALGWRWAGCSGSLTAIMGRFVFSLIPISIAYHFAHYLSDTLVNLQYLGLALNDPFGNGADLLGLGHYHVTASFQNTASGSLAIFTAQTCAIIIGHMIGVGVAHAVSLQLGKSGGTTLKLEAPVAVLMVIYTAFGLWLLSTPSIT